MQLAAAAAAAAAKTTTTTTPTTTTTLDANVSCDLCTIVCTGFLNFRKSLSSGLWRLVRTNTIRVFKKETS
jgi:hypothetical protein